MKGSEKLGGFIGSFFNVFLRKQVHAYFKEISAQIKYGEFSIFLIIQTICLPI